MEYQGFFTHGYEPFENTEKQLVLLKKWKQKALKSQFYKNAIHIWTEADVNKYEVAKKNRIKLVRIYPKLLKTKITLNNLNQLTAELRSLF